jgi:CubicO group peptidase (beta-lactamase class C family)
MNALYALDKRGQGHGSAGVIVPWWSFTKTVIAVACLRAVEDGLLSLDEPLRASKHSLRQLLRHEAGLPDYGAWPDYQRAVADRLDPGLLLTLCSVASPISLMMNLAVFKHWLCNRRERA